jgi:hypothetical protein
MATLHQQPASFDAALAMLPSLPRPLLSRLVTRMIQRLDEIDGDPDCDEDDAEDAFGFSGLAQRIAAESGPGCPIADVGEEHDHGGGGVCDEGEAEEGRVIPAYGINQSLGPLPIHTH